MVPSTSFGRLIRKRLHPAPDIDSVDPNFGGVFDPVLHGPELNKLELSHLLLSRQSALKNLIKQYWRIFSKKGITVPVKDYQCKIDTGNARPIACKNPTFGPVNGPVIFIVFIHDLNYTWQDLAHNRGIKFCFTLKCPFASFLFIYTLNATWQLLTVSNALFLALVGL